MNEAKQTIKNNLKNETVVVACSGGPDSMTLLKITNDLKEELNLKIVCAHVNHKIRPESDDEAIMVEDYCKQNGISFEYMTIDSYNNINFHQDARIKRYEFFNKCVKKCKAKHLLTAHHGDDLMETILMRIVRGATFKSYAGFSEKIENKSYTILRPLITYTKNQVLNYAKENKIPYSIDNSNNKDDYTRNRFRKYVLPQLKEEDKNVHKKFYKFSKTIELYDEYINKDVEKHYNQIIKNAILNTSEFQKLDKIIQIRIINKMLEEEYQNNLSLITDKHRDLIYKILTSNKPNQEISLPNHKKAIKTYNEFYIKTDNPKTTYQIELVDYITLPNQKTIEIIEDTDDTTNYTIRLSKQELKFPLYIRTRLDGDKIEIKGLDGHKKVKDIFIDEKIPKEERDLWPILVDSNENIIWIPGLKKSKFDKQKRENYDIILKYH